MDLREYLSQPGNTQTGLASQLGVSQGLIHQWLHGITRITPERAVQIESITDGQCSRRELLPDFPWEPQVA